MIRIGIIIYGFVLICNLKRLQKQKDQKEPNLIHSIELFPEQEQSNPPAQNKKMLQRKWLFTCLNCFCHVEL
nr:MAG TPA: hypothetical protein [Caudoviricetes sp.]